ncbi:Putative two-component response regulator [hydrothermal vent metagenome]|uniref:Putative two-component response regulator n=1 Tax=hydrothermal vent metagenome TaxID=652676 RepID=A0A1W1CN42_9ZZZZ
MDINIVKLKKYAATCSVLYVEDDELIRSATASFLGRFFSDIVLAEDGLLGLATYNKRKFDVIITDINMPNMTGIEMIEAIKKTNYEQAILVTSAYNDSENLMKLLDLNVNRFVLKPFNNKQFLYVLYKIAEELTFSKEAALHQAQIQKMSKRSQEIVDQIDVGIIVFKDYKIDIANQAFLTLGGFNSFDTLELEMPEIGVLFEEATRCISVTKNEEFIKSLQNIGKEESKVRIIQKGKTIEYQVSLSALDEANSYVVTFTDITALHNAMYMDEHTKLPSRKFTLEKIDLLKQKTKSLTTIFMSIKHFEHIEKIYGKKAATALESAFSTNIKKIREQFMPETFIGHFNKNMFIIVPPISLNTVLFLKGLKEITLSSESLSLRKQSQEKELKLFINVQTKELDMSKELSEIEVEFIHIFEMM